MNSDRDLDRAHDLTERLRAAVGRTVVGLEATVDAALIGLLARGHVLLEGVPGVGKTLLVRALASALGLQFSRVQFTPDLMPADVLGTHILRDDEGGRRLTFAAGPIFAHIVLADEINRATPKTQSALLEAMEERSVTVGRATYALEAPFIVLATQNPIEMQGTYPLPEAQIDRFLLKLRVTPPSLDSLLAITERTTESAELRLPDPAATADDVLMAQDVVREIPLAAPLREYVARLVLATHPGNPLAPPLVRSSVELGASPRGALAVILAAKARALLDGVPNVRRADLEAVFRPALEHRVILNFRGEAEGVTAQAVLDAVWEETPILTAGRSRRHHASRAAELRDVWGRT